jgi:hypothetical protein
LDRSSGKIAAAFIITGPNIASQDLLFGQLGSTLRTATQARFVGLRASEAPNLKAALKKIIRDATARVVDEEEDDLELSVGQDVSSDLLALKRSSRACGTNYQLGLAGEEIFGLRP